MFKRIRHIRMCCLRLIIVQHITKIFLYGTTKFEFIVELPNLINALVRTLCVSKLFNFFDSSSQYILIINESKIT